MRKIKDPSFSALERQELNLGGKSRHIDGGLNTADLPYSLDYTQSPDMLNMWFYDGALRKRWGQKAADSLESGTGIDSSCVLLDGKVLFQSAGKIYKWDPETETSSIIYTLTVPQGGTAAPVGSFIRYGKKVYYINGCEFKVYDNGSVSSITPYVPTLYKKCEPETGEGDFCESANILTARYCISFTVPIIQSASGVTVNIFRFPKNLAIASALVTAKVNGVTYTENSGFTVDRSSRTISFTNGIAQGTVVDFYAEDTGFADPELIKCRFGIVYGGESRLILGGNGTNVVYCSEIYDPSYFPASEYFEVGDGDEITGFGRQYNILAVFKTHEIASLTTTYSASKPRLVPSVLNPFIGCDIPGSIANIGNRIVFANTSQGVHIVTSTSHDTERNVVQISRNINNMLLAEQELKTAEAVVFDGKYWLCVNGHVYLWDNENRPLTQTRGVDAQRELAWYYFEGINAGTFFELGGRLYYGRRNSASADGEIVEFINEFSDFGAAIPAYWRSAVMDFGHSNTYKAIDRVWFISRSIYPSKAHIKYLYDERSGDTAVDDGQDISLSSFNWEFWNWSGYTWAVPGYFKTYTRLPRRRRVIFFSVRLENDTVGTDLSIADISIQYHYEYKIK